jgi:RecJ-like exonuclease
MTGKHRQIKCGRCDGKGIVASWTFDGPMPDECPDCSGSGQVTEYRNGSLAKWPGGPFLAGATKARTIPSQPENFDGTTHRQSL